MPILLEKLHRLGFGGKGMVMCYFKVSGFVLHGIHGDSADRNSWFRKISWDSVGVSEGFDVQGQVSDHSPNDSGLAVTVDFLLTDGKSWQLMWAG